MRILRLGLCLAVGILLGVLLSPQRGGPEAQRARLMSACEERLEKFLATGLSRRSGREERMESMGTAYIEAGCPYGALLVAMTMTKEWRAVR